MPFASAAIAFGLGRPEIKTAKGDTPCASSDGRGYFDFYDRAVRLRLRDVPPRIPVGPHLVDNVN